MANQQIAGLAMLVALAFMILALAACANTEQVADANPAMIAPIPAEPGTPVRVRLSVASDCSDATLSGTVRLRCAPAAIVCLMLTRAPAGW